MSPSVSLVIPTYNAGPEFPEILRLMMEQEIEGSLEVVIVDSGSTDGTVEFLETQPVQLIRIPNSEFNHGLTRNRGVQATTGEIVILATQDARPNDDQWMRRLVDCYQDPEVVGAYSRQIPRPDANPFIRDRLEHWVASQLEPRVQSIESREEFEALPPLEKLGRVAFDNVSSSVRRRVALDNPFRRKQFAEDLDWGYRILLSGYKIVFEPRSTVVHSHDNSIWYEFKRIYLDHQNLHQLLGVHTVPRWQDVLRNSRAEMLRLWGVVAGQSELSGPKKLYWKARAVPFAFSQNLAQFLGARSVSRLAAEKSDALILDRILRRGV